MTKDDKCGCAGKKAIGGYAASESEGCRCGAECPCTPVCKCGGSCSCNAK